ncbi:MULTISPECIES: serine/threonine-protein kinase [unclassified Herbaspirillum]|uniref:serine/threonine-protein kinase n=1 Tax=unclassified Herbaspirillum TaxID=2624150 RepID=UPI000E2ED587|nr:MULTISPECIES: serine/threonine-protein kinase [unclassified Herbaspirillum]RFB72949.1 serine/threonine protein kinase [Herbaspirillum sp. 3R-3a1]TFI11240.1 serine/threonine protein kinase [Herbaspirillum sp. 3R11]TFI17149.1 serine/threonine protein kinase [Herbaspirillum sp. 3R-11]TFI28896.1 serine/threonine protein kinase [Herbaspirillum sp. 3C11]
MNLPNRYQPTGASNSGGMGDIHHCMDTHLTRPVVLKMLRVGTDRRRLLDEQLALIKVRSKHVVQLYDVIEVGDAANPQTALVLEHLDGHDLSPESFAPDPLYLKTLWQIACGLVEIHSEGIIHRDIKPNNIRLGADGVIKILDFGLARSSGIEAHTRSIIGTPGYMAPELWRDQSISFDQAIDVYAFGITALVLITQQLPQELLPHPPQNLPRGRLVGSIAGIQDDILAIIERCLSYSPADRPKMTEVELILRRHILFGRHRGLIVLGPKSHELNAESPRVTVKSGSTNSISLVYDGMKFLISGITGTVAVNAKPITPELIAAGEELPDCCVIAFGPKPARTFVTFDVSNPEVMP